VLSYHHYGHKRSSKLLVPQPFHACFIYFLVSVQEDLQILFPDGHFESEQVIEEQQMILQQLPKTTKDCYYREATPPPALHIFTQLREDGENAMHFYSNPNFFFEYWRLSVQQKAEEEAKIIEIDVSILTCTLWCNLWLVMELLGRCVYCMWPRLRWSLVCSSKYMDKWLGCACPNCCLLVVCVK